MKKTHKVKRLLCGRLKSDPHETVRYYLFLILIGLFCISPSMSAREFSSQTAQQQSVKKVTGTIVDEKGEPVIGASIVVDKTSTATLTNIDGKFTINVPDLNAKLKVSYIGYKTQLVSLNNSSSIRIVMSEDSRSLDEVQIVAYGSQKKVSITGAISGVNGAELLRSPVTSLGNALTGKINGISVVQYSGEPGADNPVISIRGAGAPLTLVDGVERDFTQIDPNEVENITVLKDASSTAVFGVRGANGVILVTTKRGVEGKPKVSLTTSFGMQVPTRLLEFANSYQYASFYNEAQMNDGVTDPAKLKFQPNVLKAFQDHSNPLLYPDTDWLDMVLKPAAMQSQHNINISGGAERVKYFVSIGATTQGGLFKTFESGYDFNFDYKRYNYRANLDIEVSKSTQLAINLGGYTSEKNTPISNEDQNQLFRQLYWATPFSGAGIVDGKWIKTNPDIVKDPGSDGLSPYYGKGYNAKTTNSLNLDLMLQQKLDFITRGLSFKVKGSYNTEYTHNKQRSSSIPYYTPVINSAGETVLMKSGDNSQLGFGESLGAGRNWYAEASMNYARKFGNHNVTALALYNQSKTYYPSTFSDIPTGYVGLVGRITYDYLTRYLLEVNMGYNGSENFAPGKRYGFLPALSAGWIVTGENFMKDQKIVDYLKLRASYGVVGNDKIGGDRFLYAPSAYYTNGEGYNFGTNVSSSPSGAYEGKMNNPNITWEKEYKQNYGLDANFLKNRLKLTCDYFSYHRENILINMNSIPAYLGMSVPALNKGIRDTHGFEVSLKWEDKLSSKFRYWVNGNISFARNKVIENDEVKPNQDYLWRTGHPSGQPFVRTFWGFYDATANERYKAQYGSDIATHAGGLKPGDCVYVDLNKDGVINADDVSAQGYTDSPEYTASLTLGFSYKGFDLSMLINGACNTSRLLTETFSNPMGDTNSKGLLLSQYENRWTPETAATATLPRASIQAKSNNIAGSTLFLVDASYIRLKNIEVGYNFNFEFMKKAGISSLRLFANGYNLITLDKLKIADPESRTSDRPNYPLTKVFNVGLKVGF